MTGRYQARIRTAQAKTDSFVGPYWPSDDYQTDERDALQIVLARFR